MNRKLDLSKGQKVFVKIEEGSYASKIFKESGGMSFENVDQWLFEGEVLSVGHKYIKVKFKWQEDKFEVENDYRQYVTCGSSDYKLYTSKQEILDEFESEKLYHFIKREFDSWKNNHKFTLEQLKAIDKVISR